MQNMTKKITKICKPILNMQNTDRSIFCIFVIYMHSPLCWWPASSMQCQMDMWTTLASSRGVHDELQNIQTNLPSSEIQSERWWNKRAALAEVEQCRLCQWSGRLPWASLQMQWQDGKKSLWNTVHASTGMTAWAMTYFQTVAEHTKLEEASLENCVRAKRQMHIQLLVSEKIPSSGLKVFQAMSVSCTNNHSQMHVSVLW